MDAGVLFVGHWRAQKEVFDIQCEVSSALLGIRDDAIEVELGGED